MRGEDGVGGVSGKLKNEVRGNGVSFGKGGGDGQIFATGLNEWREI